MWTPSLTQEQREVGCREGKEVNSFVDGLVKRHGSVDLVAIQFVKVHIFVFIYQLKLTKTLGHSIAGNINAKNRATLHPPNQLYALDLHRKSTIVHVEGIPSPPHHLPTRYSTHSLHASTALTPYPLTTPSTSSCTSRVHPSVQAQQNATPDPTHHAPSRSSAGADDAERGRRP